MAKAKRPSKHHDLYVFEKKVQKKKGKQASLIEARITHAETFGDEVQGS